jgi:hypothetical protein
MKYSWTLQSKYIGRRRSGIYRLYRAEKRRTIEMAPYSRNIEGHNIEDKIHCTVSKLVEIFFSRLSLCKSTTTG